MSQPSVSQPVGESQLPEEQTRKRCTDSIHQEVALCPNHLEAECGKRWISLLPNHKQKVFRRKSSIPRKQTAPFLKGVSSGWLSYITFFPLPKCPTSSWMVKHTYACTALAAMYKSEVNNI